MGIGGHTSLKRKKNNAASAQNLKLAIRHLIDEPMLFFAKLNMADDFQWASLLTDFLARDLTHVPSNHIFSFDVNGPAALDAGRARADDTAVFGSCHYVRCDPVVGMDDLHFADRLFLLICPGDSIVIIGAAHFQGRFKID